MYETVTSEAILSQGDLIGDCPLITIRTWPHASGEDVLSETWTIRVVVLTQTCDLAQGKTTRVVVAPVREAAQLVATNILKASAIRDQIRRGLVFGWYFLPTAPAPINLAESIVDLRELHTVERSILEYLVGTGKRVCRQLSPWREHLAQHFGATYTRVALPEPYATEP